MIGKLNLYTEDCRSGSVKYEDASNFAPKRVQIRQNADDIGAIVGPETGNLYVIENNFLVYGKETSELEAIGQRWLNSVGYTRFNTCSVDVNGRPWVELGDNVIVQGERDTLRFPILKRSIKGIQALVDTYSAKGQPSFNNVQNGVKYEITQLRGLTNELIRTNKETVSKLTAIDNVWDESQLPAGESINIAGSGDPNKILPKEYVPTNDELYLNQVDGMVWKYNKGELRWETYLQLPKTFGNIETIIHQTASQISLTAQDNGTSCGITIKLRNAGGGDVGESYANITMQGLVSFKNLQNRGETIIDGGNIYTDNLSTISADMGKLHAGEILFVGDEILEVHPDFDTTSMKLVHLTNEQTSGREGYYWSLYTKCMAYIGRVGEADTYYKEDSPFIQVSHATTYGFFFVDSESGFEGGWKKDELKNWIIRNNYIITRDQGDQDHPEDHTKPPVIHCFYGFNGDSVSPDDYYNSSNSTKYFTLDYNGKLIAKDAEISGEITGSSFEIKDNNDNTLMRINKQGYIYSEAGGLFKGMMEAEDFGLGRSAFRYSWKDSEGYDHTDYRYRFRVHSEGTIETYGSGFNAKYKSTLTNYSCCSEVQLAVWGVGYGKSAEFEYSRDDNKAYPYWAVPMQLLFINGLYCGTNAPSYTRGEGQTSKAYRAFNLSGVKYGIKDTNDSDLPQPWGRNEDCLMYQEFTEPVCQILHQN